MNIKDVETAKLRHNLHKYGRAFTFTRAGTNSAGEPDPNAASTQIILTGIFHENAGGIQMVSVSDSGRIVTKPLPMILCLWEDFYVNKVMLDDELEFNDTKYKAVAVLNVGQLDFAADISLEKVI